MSEIQKLLSEHSKVRINIPVYEKFDLLNNAKRNATCLVVEEIYFYDS